MLSPSYPYILSHLQAGYPPCCGGSINPPFRSLTSPFYVYLFQPFIFIELYDWVILTGWTAIWLMLAAIAFFLLQTPRTKKAWWQYLALLLVGAVGIWSLVVAYNGYQRWLYLNLRLPAHGGPVIFMLLSQAELATIQSYQWQFAPAASALVFLLGCATWKLQRAFTRKLDLAPGKYYGRLLMSIVLSIIGLCGLTVGIFLSNIFYSPLTFTLLEYPFPHNVPTLFILISLFTVCPGGPLILLLLSLAAFMERRSLVKRPVSRERRLPAMEKRVSQRT